MRFSAAELADHLDGELVGPDLDIEGASIDSRTIRPGQLYVPIVAERDGHGFIPKALEAGASAYLTAREPVGGTAISVPDTDAIWTYADHPANDTQPRNVAVDRAVARLYAAQAIAEALELNRAGRFEEATARLKATARRIEQYAGSDPELRAILESLRERDIVYAQPMMAGTSKAEHYGSFSVARMRAPDGKARRRPTS